MWKCWIEYCDVLYGCVLTKSRLCCSLSSSRLYFFFCLLPGAFHHFLSPLPPLQNIATLFMDDSNPQNILTSFMDDPLQNHEFVAHYLLHVSIFSFVSYLELWIVHILYVSWSVECIWYRSYLWERHWRNDIVNLFPYTLYRLGLANYGQNWQILSKKLLDIFACCLKMFKNPTIFNIVHWVTKQLIDQASDVPSMY